MVGLPSDMGALRCGGKLREAVLGPTGWHGSASAAERPAPMACALARRRGASAASSRSRRAAAVAPDILEGGAIVIRRRKAANCSRRDCMGAMGVAGPAPHAAFA